MLVKNALKTLEKAGYVVKKPMTKAEAGRLGGSKRSPAQIAAARRRVLARWSKHRKSQVTVENAGNPVLIADNGVSG